MELLLRVYEQSRDVQPQIGNTRWDLVLDDMATRAAGFWREVDLAYAYNCAKTFAAPHMGCVQDFHFHHVNATVLRVETAFF